MSAPLLVAHRGAPRRGTGQNTVRAFREAVEAGADGVELDVRLTKDGRLAVFHDADAEVRGKRVAVRALAYEDLRDPAVEVHDRVPTLEEAIRALLGRTGVIVEVKEPGIEGKVASILTSLKAETRLPWLVVASFHPSVVKGLARAAPGIRRALVVSPRGPGFSGAIRGRIPLMAWRSSGAQDLLADHELATAPLCARVGEGGGRVFAWTVNDADGAARVAEAGVAGVITDDPAVVKPALDG